METPLENTTDYEEYKKLWVDNSSAPGISLSSGTVPQVDLVNSPPHYRSGEIETIQAIKSALTPEEFRGYLKGNIIKYVWRERLKGGVTSLQKAGWYLDYLVDTDLHG